MSKISDFVAKEKTAADVAADGLLAGIGAGVLSALSLILAGLAIGHGPALVLGRFDPGPTSSAAVGGVMHLAVSAVYGALFAVGIQFLVRFQPRLRPLGWLWGLMYGFLLLALAESFFLPAADSRLLEVPILHFGLFHAVYGLTLGFQHGRYGRAQRQHEV